MKTAPCVLVCALLLQSVSGVKDYLFKSCDNSGFCHRNRHFGRSVAANDQFTPKYSVNPDNIVVKGPSIEAVITKRLPNGLRSLDLPLDISVLQGGSIHIRIDEARDYEPPNHVNHRRYNETSAWSFASDRQSLLQDADILVEADHVLVVVDKSVTARIEFAPFRIVVFHANIVVCIVNDRDLLNLEHRRAASANEAHLWPEETDFDMFSDSFGDARDDTLPMGPELVALDVTFPGFTHVYGIPEHADLMNLKDTVTTSHPYRLYNVDIFEYELDSRLPMYGSIPLMLALKPGASVGFFWINAADTFVDIDKSADTKTHWMSENGVLEFIVMVAATPAEINTQYGTVTGFTQLPQLLSLGYHQCRWNYNDEKDVLSIHRLMDAHHIPYDYIWLDIEYAESKKYFTWNRDNFPDPHRMLEQLDHTGRSLVIIIDPHLKTNYLISDEVCRRHLGINANDNATYRGHCWPGELVWIDTLNPSARAYWLLLFEYSSDNEFMGKTSQNLQIWNDMNEPSVFNGPETTSPRDNLHYGNWEHRSIHNLFGLTFHEATYEAMVSRFLHSDKRPFILTRSYFAGSQRTAAMWTGDNMSKWEYLKVSIPMVLTLGIAGMPFAGADVGGFFGNPSKELLTRWYQTGIWYPFFRAHAHIDSRRREPWVPGEPYTSVIRDAIQLRYALLPMMYTAFHQASTTGVPVMKPLFYESQQEANFGIEDEFFLGNSGILVKPVTEEAAKTVEFYLPDSSLYYEFDNGHVSNRVSSGPGYIEKAVELSTIPMMLKGGSIVASKNRSRRSAKLMFDDPFQLVVALDDHGAASGVLYVDDGETFGYKHGHSLEIALTMRGHQLTANVVGSEAFKHRAAEILIEKITIVSSQAQSLQAVKANQAGRTWLVRFDGSVLHNLRLSIASDWEVVLADNVHDEL